MQGWSAKTRVSPSRTEYSCWRNMEMYPRMRPKQSAPTGLRTQPEGLNTLLVWVACIAAAQPIEGYQADLESAGLEVMLVERHPEALITMIESVRTRLIGAELLVRLKGIDLRGANFDEARTLARRAAESAQNGRLGYALLVASKG